MGDDVNRLVECITASAVYINFKHFQEEKNYGF